MPFQNISGDPAQEYFCDGVVEDVITGLSRMKWLFVIARNSSFTYKGRTVDVKQVGRELGVRYMLEDSVRKSVTECGSPPSSSKRRLDGTWRWMGSMSAFDPKRTSTRPSIGRATPAS